MGISEALRGGLRVINRNWQLVPLHLVVSVINCIFFLLIMILPLFLVAFSLGLRLSSFRNIHSPADIIALAPGIVLFAIVLFLVYILVVTTIGLFVFSGSAGVLSRTVMDEDRRFALGQFFSEAKRLFIPVLSYTALVGLIAILMVGIFAIFLFALPVASVVLRGISHVTSSLVTALLSLLIFSVFIITILFLLALMLFGVARIAFRGGGSVATLREVTGYLFKRPLSFAVYVIAVLLYLIVNILAVLLGMPFQSVRGGMGVVLSLPLQLLYYVFQSYTGLWILSVVLLYYYRTEIEHPEVVDREGTLINEE